MGGAPRLPGSGVPKSPHCPHHPSRDNFRVDGSASGPAPTPQAPLARPCAPRAMLTRTALGGARPRRPAWAALGLSLTISLLWRGVPVPRLSSAPPSPRCGPDVEAESPPSGRGNAEEEAGTAPLPLHRGLQGSNQVRRSGPGAAQETPRRRRAPELAASLSPCAAVVGSEGGSLIHSFVKHRFVEHLLCVRHCPSAGRSPGRTRDRVRPSWISLPAPLKAHWHCDP